MQQDVDMTRTSPHNCIYQQKIGELINQVEQHDHIINGNGSEGLTTTVPRLVYATEQLTSQVKELTDTYKAVNLFITTSEARRKVEEEIRDKERNEWVRNNAERERRYKTWSIIQTAAIVVLGIITLLYGSGVMSSKKVLYTIPINDDTRFRGEPVDSVYWSDEENPPMIFDFE